MGRLLIQIALLITFVAVPLSFGLWINGMIQDFGLARPYGPELKRALPLAFSAPNLQPLTYRSLAWGVGAAGALQILLLLLQNPHQRPFNHVRGSSIARVSVLRRMTHAATLRNRLMRMRRWMAFARKRPTLAAILAELLRAELQTTVGGVPVPVEVEPLHFLVAGTTGAGKSQAIKEMLKGAQARGDRMIVVDPNGDYYSIFGRPQDIVLNPFDERSPGWSLFNEIRSDFDCERYSRSVIPEGHGDLKEWHGSAQFMLKETLLKLHSQGCRETKVLTRFICELNTKQLGEYLADTAAAGMFAEGGEKSMGSVRFIATRFLGPHKHPRPGSFSLRDWLEAGEGNLYITWREDMADALRPLISTWYDVLITSTLSTPVVGQPRPVWFVCDELASMEQLSSLEAGLTKGRKHGARFLSGIQSTAQLDALYGKEKAITLRSCYRNVLFLNIPNSDPATAEELSKGIGDVELIRKELSVSYGRNGQRTVNKRRVTEKLILPSQIHDLPNLQGYLCFAGDYPISRVKLAAHLFPPVAQPYVQRSDLERPASATAAAPVK